MIRTDTHFTRRFSAAHRIVGGGICEHIHGHNYMANIVVSANVWGECNFIVPADRIKEVVDGKYDHMLILSQSDPWVVLDRNEVSWATAAALPGVLRVTGTPSTEFLAAQIAEDVADTTWDYLGGVVRTNLEMVEVDVTLHETPSISAHAFFAKVRP